MEDFPFGQLPDAYLNVKEAAKEPWRGITAWIQGMPHLIVDRDGENYIIESEDGQTLTTNAFERWASATDQSRLVAASRVEGSPFTHGSKVGGWEVGNLVFFEGEWQVRAGNSSIALPLERMVEDFDSRKWAKVADFGDEMTCPDCGSHDIVPSQGYDHSMWECLNCGKEGYAEEFEDPNADDRADRSFYDFDFESAVESSVKTAATFEYQLPPHGIHFRTHAEMKRAGLTATVTYPGGVSPEFPEGLVAEVPGPSAMDQMAYSMDAEMEGIPLDTITVTVDTPDDPEQVRALFDQLGGRTAAKVADIGQQDTVDTRKKALTCPRCGSHTLRAFPPDGNETTIVCLTCGNEFERKVMKNPEASVKEALGPTYPTDPAAKSQIIGLMQQISQASEAGNRQLVMQLQQQLEQLLGGNPNMPQQQASLTKEAPGKEHMKGVSPKRNRQYEHILESCKKEHPDYSLDRCKELAARTVNKQREEKGETKDSSLEDCGCDKNSGWKVAEEWDISPGDVIAAYPDGTVVLDDGITTFNPASAYQFFMAQNDRESAEAVASAHPEVREIFNYPHGPQVDGVRSKTAADGKYPPGTRVQVDHPNLKGRGTVLECEGKHADLGDENYVIQMDSGEKVNSIPETAFRRIKSAHVDNDGLPDSTKDFFLESMEVDFESVEAAQTFDDIDDPYNVPQQENLNDYTQADPMDEEGDYDYAHCPACDGPGVLLGQLGSRIHYRCRNCGLDFSHKLDEGGQGFEEPGGYDIGEDPGSTEYDQRYPLASLDAVKEVNKNTLKAFKDSSGNPLEAGRLYVLHHPSYKVPDVVKILNLEENRIEAAIASDDGSFPIHIKDTDAYSFDPYEHKTSSGWVVEARKNFTSDEQRELINENLDGRARNFDKLKLDGTHYQLKEESYDPNFLWGI